MIRHRMKSTGGIPDVEHQAITSPMVGGFVLVEVASERWARKVAMSVPDCYPLGSAVLVQPERLASVLRFLGRCGSPHGKNGKLESRNTSSLPQRDL
jgi:hypothetical protein